VRKNAWNDNWTYRRAGEKQSVPVTLPHDAMFLEKRSAKSAGGANTGWFEGCDYIYEKKFSLPLEYKNKRVILEFEGVYRNAEIYVNNSLAAFRPNGYIGFTAECGNLRFGEENVIRVAAKNSDQPNSRWYTGAGLYRPVNLYILPEKHILVNGVKIRTLDYTIPEIEIEAETNGDGVLGIEILDQGKIMYAAELPTKGRAAVQAQLPRAGLWDCEHPRLYTCRVTFGEDVLETAFGIRQIQCGSQLGFRINGEKVLLRGCCVHHDNGLLGACAYAFAEERKVRLLKENGYNAIRTAHNPCSSALLEACDKLGVLVVEEYTDMWYIHKTKYDYAGYFSDWWRQDLRDLAARDYNHPSLVMYSMGNEVSETAQKRGAKLSEEMASFCRALDSTRPVTCGINLFFNLLSSLGFGVYSDKKALRTAEGRKAKAVGSEFFNNLAGLLGAPFMKFGAALRGSDKKTREAFSKFDVAGYNYGIKRYKKDFKKYPQRVILGTETFCADTYAFVRLAEKNPALIGDFVWSGMDYLGEVGLGSWDYREYAPDFTRGLGWLTAGTGKLDITGKPTGESAYTKVAYGLDDIRIAVIPVHTFREKHAPSAWRMTNAVESWSWDGGAGKKTAVEVYARAYAVELFVNGKRRGRQKAKNDCKFVFIVNYQEGELQAVAYNRDAEIIAETSLVTAGADTVLSAVPERKTINMADLCYARLRYTDSKGIWKPSARGHIKIRAQGGKVLGFGNACPYNPTGYLTDTSDTYYGEAVAVIKPECPGKMTLYAESRWGEASAEVTVRGDTDV
jgi:beta-galactosidase